ncbi:MAG TPA: hypothetical protein DEB32_10785 [Stenotrophomonas sp.]|nr:hypothetical protein [Stenotrophomonas sp.]
MQTHQLVVSDDSAFSKYIQIFDRDQGLDQLGECGERSLQPRSLLCAVCVTGSGGAVGFGMATDHR